MHLKYLRSLATSSAGVAKITSICYSPNSMRLASVGANKKIYLYDENGEQKDKFQTKAADGKVKCIVLLILIKTKNYYVRCLSFSPDSSKLAVAQTDNIVFVYKLGTKWEDRKTICNKWPTTSMVTCLCWPSNHQNELFFGLVEGNKT